jgi:hypothetical protein
MVPAELQSIRRRSGFRTGDQAAHCGIAGQGSVRTSVNTWLRCVNAYLRWNGVDLKIPRIKEEQKILATIENAPAPGFQRLPEVHVCQSVPIQP